MLNRRSQGGSAGGLMGRVCADGVWRGVFVCRLIPKVFVGGDRSLGGSGYPKV